ncbi:hypothetical protein WCLP8_850008 [uncultured Gammaproteobacteria bacterium]
MANRRFTSLQTSTVVPQSGAGIGHNRQPREPQRMYAVAFDLDTNILKDLYPNSSWNNAYSDIRKALEPHGFIRQQGSVYFGDDQVDAVKCVLAVMTVATQFPWFEPVVKDIRMLRIEDNNDLMPAVRQASARK